MNHVIAPTHADFNASTAAIWAWLAAWLGLATTVAASGVITLERRFVIPIAISFAVAALILAWRRSPRFQAFARGLDLRVPVLLHAVRAPIGAAFLWMMESRHLDPSFATVAGWGDIAAGLGALVAAACLPMTTARRRRVVLAWNLLGLVDILAVVLNAQRILVFSGHPETLGSLLVFPGPLLPTFVVPLVIATHLLVFARARR